MKRLHLWVCSRVRGIHPRVEDLLRWADGEQIQAIRKHLEQCARCREQVQALVAAREATERTNVEDSEFREQAEEIFERLQLQMQAWCSLGTPSKIGRIRRGQQIPALSAALEFYFGAEMAKRIEGVSRWDVGEPILIPVTKPLFSTFLGKRAAEVLAQKIASATT